VKFRELKIGDLFESDLWMEVYAEYCLARKDSEGSCIEISNGVRHLMPDDFDVILVEQPR
jgi:hypothetical protein